ncbi:MAG: Asp-tRNA(Asn)/Glu-tRNA(Gln) amidotransferase subunit GatC [Terriglobales bacterium]
MNVTLKEVAYVADLANLDLTPEERERMVKDLNAILGFIDQLNELDTTNVPPMAQVMAGSPKETGSQAHAYARRPDDAAARPSLPHEAALANAPVKNPDFFKVPKVIER